jgi:hypothetical protein
VRLLLEQPDGRARRELRLAPELGVEPGHDPQQRGLAGAVQAQHADLGAGQEAQRDVLEHLLVGGMRPGQLVHREDVLARHGRLRIGIAFVYEPRPRILSMRPFREWPAVVDK